MIALTAVLRRCRRALPAVALPAVALVVLLLPARADAIEVQRVVSDAGIEAWLVEDRSLPILALEAIFRDAGAVTDPEGKAGRAYMVGGLLNEGAGDMDALTFQRRLEDLAVHMGFDAGRDSFQVSLKTLTENRDEAFRLLRLALTEPRFDAQPVERVRSQIQAGLARDLQDPRTIAWRAWFETQFPDHPYGTPVKGTPESVAALTADDLRAFVTERLARGNLILGVVGDIDAAALKALLDETFGALPTRPAPLDIAEAGPAAPAAVTVREFPVPQSTVVFGHRGLSRDDPDFYAAMVVNYVLGGGGFTSRLMEEVREKRGLAYGIGTSLRPLDHAPLMLGSVATRNDRVGETIDILRQEWARMREQGPTPEELTAATTYLVGSFPLELTSTSAIAGMLTAIQRHGLGIDYIDRRASYIEAVTADDARRVAERLLRPEHLAAVVVGEPSGLSPAAN